MTIKINKTSGLRYFPKVVQGEKDDDSDVLVNLFNQNYRTGIIQPLLQHAERKVLQLAVTTRQ